MSVNLFHGDCRELLDGMIQNNLIVNMVMTSPPYDNIKNYDNTNAWDFEVFKSVADRLYKVVCNGGVIIWVVADKTDKGSESGTSMKQALYFKEIGFNIHDTMIYRKINYMPLNHNRYEQAWEYMFCFSKGKPNTFNPIKIPCKYAGTEKWGATRFYKTDDDELTNVGDKKIIHDEKLHENVFEYRIGSTNETKKFKHPAMYPLQLVKDQIQSWTNEGDIVLDPFMGAGTTGQACVELNRNFIGCEIVDKYFNMCQERLCN